MLTTQILANFFTYFNYNFWFFTVLNTFLTLSAFLKISHSFSECQPAVPLDKPDSWGRHRNWITVYTGCLGLRRASKRGAVPHIAYLLPWTPCIFLVIKGWSKMVEGNMHYYGDGKFPNYPRHKIASCLGHPYGVCKMRRSCVRT